MIIKLGHNGMARCKISEMPGEEEFDLEIKMQLDQTVMNQIVSISQLSAIDKKYILNIDAILCNSNDLKKIKEDYRYNLKIIVIEDVDGTNIIARTIILNNVAFHNLKHFVPYNGTQVESRNAEIHVYALSTCNIEPEEN